MKIGRDLKSLDPGNPDASLKAAFDTLARNIKSGSGHAEMPAEGSKRPDNAIRATGTGARPKASGSEQAK